MPEITQQQLFDASSDAVTFANVINGSAAFVQTRLGGQIQSLAAAIAAIGGTAISAHNKSVYDFGAVGDGVHDDTAAFQAAITAGIPSVFIPAGTFRITSSLTLQSNTGIRGCGAASTIYTTAGALFIGNNLSNVSIESITVTGATNTIAVSVNSVINLRLFGIVVQNGGLFRVSSVATGALIADVSNAGFNCNRNILIDHCVCNNPVTGGYADGVYILYAVDWAITNCIFEGVNNGVEWWGGDSNTTVNGGYEAPRLCKRGVISNCIARNVIAGFWGSMGENILVSGCIASIVSDVAFDDEGGKSNVFSGCYAEHAGTFLFGGFWLSNRTTFTGCIGYQDGSVGSIFFSTQNFTNTAVPTYYVLGCTFIWDGPTGMGASRSDVGMNSLTYCGNKHYNVRANFATFNMGNFDVCDNSFEVDRPDTNGTIISMGNSNGYTTKVMRNTIQTGGGTGSIGIYVTQNYYNAAIQSIIESNFILGPAISISVNGSSGNGGISMPFFVRFNSTDTQVTTSFTGGGGALISQGNMMRNGAVIY